MAELTESFEHKKGQKAQERWAPDTPQRKFVETLFAGGPCEDALRDTFEIAGPAEMAELDALLEAVTGLYHAISSLDGTDDTTLARLDELLVWFNAHGTVASMKRASHFNAEAISDTLDLMRRLASNCLPFPQVGEEVSLTGITACLRAEIAEISLNNTYRSSNRLHAAAGRLAALYGDGGSPEANAAQIHALQQHFSRDLRAPLHAVDSDELRAVLQAFGQHHQNWAERYEGGMNTAEAHFVTALTGTDGYPPQSMRQILAGLPPEQADGIEHEFVGYMQLFMREYGVGEGFTAGEEPAAPELAVAIEEAVARWPLLPDVLALLTNAPDGVGEAVTAAAGDEDATAAVLETMLSRYQRVPEAQRQHYALRVLELVSYHRYDYQDAEDFLYEVGVIIHREELAREMAIMIEQFRSGLPKRAMRPPQEVIAAVTARDGDVAEGPEVVAAAPSQVVVSPVTRVRPLPSRPVAVAAPAPPPPEVPNVAEPLTVHPELLPRERPEAAIVASGKFGELTAAQIAEGLAVVAGARDEHVDDIIAHLTSSGGERSDVAVVHVTPALRRAVAEYHAGLPEHIADGRPFRVIYGVINSLLGAGDQHRLQPLARAIERHPHIPGPQRPSAQRAAVNMMYAVLESALDRAPGRRDEILQRIGAVAPNAAR